MHDGLHNKQRTMRNSNFELLRIIAIIMITAYHYVVHGEYTNNLPPRYVHEKCTRYWVFVGQSWSKAVFPHNGLLLHIFRRVVF